MASRTVACAKKKAAAEGRVILCLAESAFYLLPGVRRTWAPIGQPPVLRCPLTYAHLSVMSAITPDGSLFLTMQKQAFDSNGVIAFLQDLLREIDGKLLLIWDGAPIHRSNRIKQFLVDGAAQRIRLEQLPAYAPDLNPDEGIWHYLKHVELANVCCKDLDELSQKLEVAADNLADEPQLIQACFHHCGYY